jgi:CheY-like chemotaxis protein
MTAEDQNEVVYVVDDDPSARESLCWLLGTEGIASHAFASAQAFLEYWSSDCNGCIMVDIRMPGKSGLQLQEELNARHNLMPVIVLTGHADVPIAIRAMKQGAYDFLEKPYADEPVSKPRSSWVVKSVMPRVRKTGWLARLKISPNVNVKSCVWWWKAIPTRLWRLSLESPKRPWKYTAPGLWRRPPPGRCPNWSVSA